SSLYLSFNNQTITHFISSPPPGRRKSVLLVCRRRRKPPPPPASPKGNSPEQWFPWLIPSFVAANCVMFVVSMFVNDCPAKSRNCIGAEFLGRFAFQPLKENPLLGPSSDALMKLGAMEVEKVVEGHQPWRLISCIWLHAGVFHLLANMLSLLFIGIRLEQEFGFIRIGMVYLLSGFGGSVMSALFLKFGISVGASGALFGLLGAMLSELITNWTIYANKFAALLTLVIIVVLNLAVGILPHVDNFAHIGGFVSGFLLGFIFLIRPQFGWVSQKTCPPGFIAPPAKSKYKAYQYVLLALALVLLISGYVHLGNSRFIELNTLDITKFQFAVTLTSKLS
ncbi:RHOMBOID-like protein 1, partial [Linum grandiflorum]